MKSSNQYWLLSVCALTALSLLSGCKQEYAIGLTKKAAEVTANIPVTGSSPAPTVAPSASPSGTPNLALATEIFDFASVAKKKIDMLFIVDNSGSMSEEQSALAAGFASVANTYFNRNDLDICLLIATSDRYLGKVSGSYQRERNIGCTNPDGQNPSTLAAYRSGLIDDFRAKINVGTAGNGAELIGKSMVSSLYDIDRWELGINSASRNPFFRSGAVSNVSFATDENNLWLTSNALEASNDIPAVKNSVIWSSSSNTLDTRKGIKDYLDEFFALVNPGQAANYSVSALLAVNAPRSGVPSLAMNLDGLSALIGRGSSRGDVQGSASDYAALYNSVMANLVQGSSNFTVAHAFYQNQVISVSKISAAGVESIVAASNYSVLNGNQVKLSDSFVASAQAGDKIKIKYNYLVP